MSNTPNVQIVVTSKRAESFETIKFPTITQGTIANGTKPQLLWRKVKIILKNVRSRKQEYQFCRIAQHIEQCHSHELAVAKNITVVFPQPDQRKPALLNKWILCCGTMKTVVSDNIKSMHYMLAYDGVLSGISVFYQNSADKTE
ncbi:hypothetical protein DSJ_26260 (plasmid) [Pantoea stewartii subsp. stewartii DC283]|uniref:Uncharacterized protein n=1 Tax=Pantoea stewartii subsp. stewartii DC283 TaxID=660596 RepID=A0ABN4Z8I1_PANSE|nr:hypothetical protein DSJ_26260 [Pantoea stewartii subsp. stewartii DC283]